MTPAWWVLLGIILAIIGYAVIRGMARLALAPWSAEWMDRRAMLARAESDALHAAQDQYRTIVDQWKQQIKDQEDAAAFRASYDAATCARPSTKSEVEA